MVTIRRLALALHVLCLVFHVLCLVLHVLYLSFPSVLQYRDKKKKFSLFSRDVLDIFPLSGTILSPVFHGLCLVLHVLCLVWYVLCLSCRFSSHGVPRVSANLLTDGVWWWMGWTVAPLFCNMLQAYWHLAPTFFCLFKRGSARLLKYFQKKWVFFLFNKST